MNPSAAPPLPESQPRPGRSRWATPGRLLLGTVVIASFGLWALALARVGVKAPPDTLASPEFATAAEPVCAAALADLDRLPPAASAQTASERAVTIDQATDRLGVMVGELRARAPKAGADVAIVAAWLADWDTFLLDRRDYAANLRQDESAQLQVTTRDGQGITKPMDNLATVNNMLSCVTPGDVG